MPRRGRSRGIEGRWGRYVSAAERQVTARQIRSQLQRQGRELQPVVIEGRGIARTFWGRAWCDQMEGCSDFENRLPRGRTYARNGSVIDLQIESGRIGAMVMGRRLYNVEVAVEPLAPDLWSALVERCHGHVHSMLDLLSGKLDRGVLEALVHPARGLLPLARELRLACSCPDWAFLCKHLAAVLYGVGARLDAAPELLFTLRQVDREQLLMASTGAQMDRVFDSATGHRMAFDADTLNEIFGLDLDEQAMAGTPGAVSTAAPRRGGRKSKSASLQKQKADSARQPGKAGKKAGSPLSPPRPLPPRLPRTLTPADLEAYGVPRSTYRSWSGRGILIRTQQRGVYATTRETRRWIRSARAARGLE